MKVFLERVAQRLGVRTLELAGICGILATSTPYVTVWLSNHGVPLLPDINMDRLELVSFLASSTALCEATRHRAGPLVPTFSKIGFERTEK